MYNSSLHILPMLRRLSYALPLSSVVLDNHAQKISHLKTLYHLACADGVYSEVEATYIKNVAIKLGIDPQVLHDFDSEEPDLVLPDTQYKIYSLFHRLVLILMIDNVAHEDEKHYCFTLGIKMGLHPNAIDEIIDHATLHGSFKTSPLDVIQIFKKYLS